MNKENPDADGVYFYYLRDDNRHPIGGVSLKKSDGVWCRGVSICSKDDKFDKEEARKKSRSRLIHAMFSKKNDYRIEPDRVNRKGGAVDNVVGDAFYHNYCTFWHKRPFKSIYDAELTDVEKRIVEED